MKMAPSPVINRFFPVIVLATLSALLQNPVSVSGDTALINRVCGQTLNTIDCSKCLNSDPNSGKADVRALAGISIQCSLTQATNLQRLLVYYYTTEQNSKYKIELGNCVGNSDSIANDVGTAQQSWRDGRYQDSINQVQDALNAYRECVNGITAPRIPSDLNEGLRKTQALCQDSIGILHQIGS
ncbi:hypothetical protein U1Q18_029798 [Sarracenia purpurea var. burkii]